MYMPAIFLAVVSLLLVLVFAVAATLGMGGSIRPANGGAPRHSRGSAASPHLVVDTLNLTHRLFGGVTPERVVEAIDTTAPALCARHSGRVMYVLKDREGSFLDDGTRTAYRDAAERNRVYVVLAEKYIDPPSRPGAMPTPADATHSALGRDDFLMAHLAHRWKCPILTEDRMRDFAHFRAVIPPFHTTEYAFWRTHPTRDYYRPDAAAFARIKKPRRVGYAEYGIVGASASTLENAVLEAQPAQTDGDPPTAAEADGRPAEERCPVESA